MQPDPLSRRQRLHLAFGRALLGARAAFGRRVTFGVRGMVIDDGRVFLVRHTYLPGWHLPGGGVEPGESAPAALARELLEEGGIRAATPPELFHLYWNRALGGRDHVALYVVRAFAPERAPRRATGEIAESGFFPTNALPDETTAATRRRLEEVLGGLRPDDVW